MAAPVVVEKLLDRLYASLSRAPSLNCRPHHSRQRVDLAQLDALQDLSPARVLVDLLTTQRATVAAKVPIPPDLEESSFRYRSTARRNGHDAPEPDANAPTSTAAPRTKDNPAHGPWKKQKALLTKLRTLSDDARTYEQDTGVHVLAVGFPLLSVPPGSAGGAASTRLLAPLALVPIDLTVTASARPSVQLACRGEDEDLVAPNEALLAWLQRQTGRDLPELFTDEQGDDPWREVREMIAAVAKLLDLKVDDDLVSRLTDPRLLALDAAPPTDALPATPAVLPAAVVGLFPLSNQGLIRDMQAMSEGQSLEGPLRAFIDHAAVLDAPPPDADAAPDATDADASTAAPPPRARRRFADERFVTLADPCQARTVKLAREVPGLVVHGPPGTGKSQTITNIIGDHLARGRRVLFVCDKRTALDVVANRLDHLGLGGLCAVVHDPQRDQRDLYMKVRAQLDELPDAKPPAAADAKLERLDTELQRLHDELTADHDALMLPPQDAPGEPSFHDLMGRWMAVDPAAPSLEAGALAGVTPATLDAVDQDVAVVLQRAQAIGYGAHPWKDAAGGTLQAHLARPVDATRGALTSCRTAAAAADDAASPDIPPFNARQSLSSQADRREQLADALQRAIDTSPRTVIDHVLACDEVTLPAHRARFADAAAALQLFAAAPLDAELALAVADRPPPAAEVAAALVDLDDYLAGADRWYALLRFGARSRAARRLRPLGLTLSPANARRGRDFLATLRARLLLSAVHRQVFPDAPAQPLVSDDALRQGVVPLAGLVAILTGYADDPDLLTVARTALATPDEAPRLIAGLRASRRRAEALDTMEAALRGADLFDPAWLQSVNSDIRAGGSLTATLAKLDECMHEVEDVLRIRAGIADLPAPLREPVHQMARRGESPDLALATLTRAVLAGQITQRLATDRRLTELDPQRLADSFDRYRKLEDDKRGVVRDAILHQWRTRQKERLLVGTGSRLNTLGADLKRRLLVRGRRALRLRQVIATGQNIEDGDPLLDLCPVWLASPETVAQVFPRSPLFEVVIFDEASQCRLEETLPVLARAQRFVVAGDPKQLPPTRFFESAAASSAEDDPQDEVELFEQQQADAEDLLTAALNLSIEQSYLDVHYRSANADLIEFSNRQFYHDRLQAIPGHPSRRAKLPPVRLVPAGGQYVDRANELEARRVVELVEELLGLERPPSIGVACFNLVQRDLIVEMLDDRAAEDAAFARKLAAARERVGKGSFEGLFVKNLENVQGDERDHIIISTTYGPDEKGRFYRRFGPLGQPGGGRRLNVLVTRARELVHLVTSIPPELYTALPPVPEGGTPSGAWLLFAYLNYAAALERAYSDDAAPPEDAAMPALTLREQPIPPVCRFSMELGRRLVAEQGISAAAHWGNAGFRVDVALDGAGPGAAGALGVLSDFNSFPRATDPVEWEVFRTAIHASQGWTLHRLWTPRYFRDPAGCVARITAELSAATA